MTELAETVAIGQLQEETEAKCPFDESAEGVDSVEEEDIVNDDTEGAHEQQSNNGGVLGKNLINASQGKEGTVGGPYPPPDADPRPRIDTNRAGLRLKVPGTDTNEPDQRHPPVDVGIYGITVAAHHLIPGEASLAPSELFPFMTKDETVKITVITPQGEEKKTKTVEKYIGYNVNGAHNGVWLPGNYFIRKGSSPVSGQSWSDLADNPWCLNYVAAATKAAGGQFHDAHTIYSEKVEELLNKIALVLMRHECSDCEKPKINPPFKVKTRLYSLSAYLKGKLTAPRTEWKLPWCASDRWVASYNSAKFARAYLEANN